MIFSRGRQPQNLKYSLHGLELEVVKSFTYLGIILSRTGNFNLAKKSIADKGIRAMYEVLKLARLHNLTIPCRFIWQNGQTCFIDWYQNTHGFILGKIYWW